MRCYLHRDFTRVRAYHIIIISRGMTAIAYRCTTLSRKAFQITWYKNRNLWHCNETTLSQLVGLPQNSASRNLCTKTTEWDIAVSSQGHRPLQYYDLMAAQIDTWTMPLLGSQAQQWDFWGPCYLSNPPPRRYLFLYPSLWLCLCLQEQSVVTRAWVID